MKMSQWMLVPGLMISVLTGTACQPPKHSPDGSNAKSLDNFARGDDAAVVVNQCGIDYTGTEALPAHVTAAIAKITSTDEAARLAVIGALVAVPEKLMKPFFDVGGEIVVSADAPTDCQTLPFSADEKTLAGSGSVPSCWRQPDGVTPPRILISANPRLIRFSLLRVFAYLYTEFFARRIEDPAAPAPYNQPEWQAAVAAFKAEREFLANAFLADLQTSKSEAFDRLVKFRDGSPEQFTNYVFAEAVDSYYCSSTARKSFEKQFSNAYKVFTNAAADNSPVSQFGAG